MQAKLNVTPEIGSGEKKKKKKKERDAKKPPPKEVPEKMSRNSTKRANRRGVNNGGRAECNPELLLLDVHGIVFILKWVSPLNGENGEPRLNNFLADFSPRLSELLLFWELYYF